tara:strand:- start:694 stop:1206 length:513 start_codon:yes stop_codon:yes gene_type:complete
MAGVYFIRLHTENHPFVEGKVIKVCDKSAMVGGDIPTAAGRLDNNPTHPDGELWCRNFFGGEDWKAFSKHPAQFRKNTPDGGHWYLENEDMFVLPQPYASWSLDTSTGTWTCPVTEPTWEEREFTDGEETKYYATHWDEENQRWLGSSVSQDKADANLYWDAANSTWVNL